jgi:hypothetical protein
VKFCEFIGNSEHTWDEPGYKKLCPHAGFEHCTLHKKPLGNAEGWRVCCKECTTPIYEVKSSCA